MSSFAHALIHHLWSGGLPIDGGGTPVVTGGGMDKIFSKVPGYTQASTAFKAGINNPTVQHAAGATSDYVSSHTPQWFAHGVPGVPGSPSGSGNLPGLPGIPTPGDGGLTVSNPNMFSAPSLVNPQGLYHPVSANLGTADAAGADQSAYGRGLMSNGAATFGQAQGLIGQLQGDAAGNGPGTALAQAMLSQATAKNVANGASQISSIKGMNPALAGKAIAENTAAQNQGAAMQGSELALQNQMNARSSLGGLLGGLYGTSTSGGTNLINTGRGQDITGALGQGQLGVDSQGQLLGSVGDYNKSSVAGDIGAGTLNKDVGIANLGAKTGLLGGLMNGAGGVLSAGIMAPAPVPSPDGTTPDNTPSAEEAGAPTDTAQTGGVQTSGGMVAEYKGGEIPDQKALSLAQTLMAHGGQVPGQPNVPGKNSPKNDTVPAVLSPKEVVLPLSVTQGKNPGELAKDFVEKLAVKAHPTFGHVLQARQAVAKAEAAHRRAMGGYA